ncbi:MAG: sugar-transfer associated ATP-grasp domain-containing protein [Thermoplasmatota archaeon]
MRRKFSRPNRFRQVQRKIRRDRMGRLPINWYGRGEILSKDEWRSAIRRYNPMEMMDISDKLEQKLRLSEAGVIIPRTYLVIENEDDLARFSDWLDSRDSGFVIKPSNGHGGSGVLVINKRTASRFIKPSGKGIEKTTLVRHAERIYLGNFSGNIPDKAIIEERLTLSRQLRELMTPGLPDIRVVVFKGFPIMAMTRLPTRRSGGRANIHQGALAAGISISEGRITSATYLRKNVKTHPSTGREIIGFRFNMWDQILEMASAAADAMEMGFVGVDLTVDQNKGVVVIEVNKRPGLEIQNANRKGLKGRMRFVKKEIKRNKMDLKTIGPGIKAELSRQWDISEWRRVKKGEGEE